MSFANFKNKRKNIATLADKMDSGSSFKKDERFYYPELEKDGSGEAVIRFLDVPMVDVEKFGEDTATPLVKTYSHGFQDKGGWYIENCPTTIGNDCPVCKANGDLVADAGGDYNAIPKNDPVKITVSARKRKMQFASNILVVSDPKNPENEGKVFLFRFGKIIYDMIMRAAKPKFADEVAVDAFDMEAGANFKLRIEKKDKQTNYDSSKFDGASPIAPTDDAIEKIWEQAYSLQEIISPENYKEYVKLEERLNSVIRKDKTNVPSAAAMDYDNDVPDMKPTQDTPTPDAATTTGEGGGENPLDYFASLASKAE